MPRLCFRVGVMIIPNEISHPFGCFLCGWPKIDPGEPCLCDDFLEDFYLHNLEEEE